MQQLPKATAVEDGFLLINQQNFCIIKLTCALFTHLVFPVIFFNIKL